MSGLEVAGIVLATFPLIISGLEQWRNVARVGGFFWRLRKEYTRCRSDVQFHEILYRRNLQELLIPVVNDADEVARLVGDPGGRSWSDTALQQRLEERLQESYTIYFDIIQEMNETVAGLKTELSFDDPSIQKNLVAPLPEQNTRRASSPAPIFQSKRDKIAAGKTKLDFEMFRVKFSLNEPVRDRLVSQLSKCNERLEKLLSTSDRICALQQASTPVSSKNSTLEAAFKASWRKSDLLFKALQNAWQCNCQQYHLANLRLEHRTCADICFDLIMMFIAPPSHAKIPWSWREIQCGQMTGCSQHRASSTPSALTPKQAVSSMRTSQKTVTFAKQPPTILVSNIEVNASIDESIQLCNLLAAEECNPCLGIISHEEAQYHIHSLQQKKPPGSVSVTLDHVLSSDFEGYFTRRQRYSLSLLLASSVAQLRSTPWLRTELTKKDIYFFLGEDGSFRPPYHKPFIRQTFSAEHSSPPNPRGSDCNFISLGILLLELCFGRRLEDHPLRQKYPAEAGEIKQAFDLLAAMKWSQSVGDEGGDDYASAVKWCFTSADSGTQSWRSEIIKNVIRPLETCQEHFKMAAAS